MRKIFKSGSLCLLFALLAACTRNRTAPDELVLGMGSQPATLDPRFASDASGMRIAQIVFSSLVKIGPNLEIKPDAAQTWNYKNLTYTFDLVPNLVFHNGRAVTVEDLIFSYQQFSSSSSLFASSFNDVESFNAEKVGDHLQVRIKMKKFVANFLGADLAIYKILPKKETAFFPKVLIGSGPFRISSKTDNEIVLERFDRHPTVVPKMPKVVIKIVHDDFTRYQKLMRGELDICLNEISIDKVPMFEKMPGQFTVIRAPALLMAYLLLNLQDPVLKQHDVRKALSQSINRAEIIHYKMDGLGTEATSVLPIGHPYFNHDLMNPPYDLSAAKAVIEKLGLRGQKLVFKSSNEPSSVDKSKVIAYQLSQSGLDFDLQVFEWGKYFSDIQHGNFQMAIMKWVGISDPDIYRTAFDSHEKPPLGRNRGHYSNKIVDELVEKAVNTEKEELRRKFYLEAQKLVFEDFAILPLWYDTQVVIMRKNVTGFKASVTGDFDTLMNVSKSETGLSAGSPLAGQIESATSFEQRN